MLHHIYALNARIQLFMQQISFYRMTHKGLQTVFRGSLLHHPRSS